MVGWGVNLKLHIYKNMSGNDFLWLLGGVIIAIIIFALMLEDKKRQEEWEDEFVERVADEVITQMKINKVDV